MKKIIVLLLVLLVFFSLPIFAFKADIKGEIEQNIVYDHDSEKFRGITELDLELSKDFGFGKILYFNPFFKYQYDEDSDFSDLDLDQELKEAYLDIYLDNADLRIGKQLLNWGTAYKTNPTDVVNPIDFTAKDLTDFQLGVTAIQCKYYYDYNTELTGVMVTDFVPSPLPVGVKQLAAQEVYNSTKAKLAAGLMAYGLDETNAKNSAENILNNYFIINDAVESDIDSLDDAEYVLQFTRRNVYGYDVSVSYFNGYEDLPSINSDLDQVEKDLGDIVGKLQINPNYEPENPAHIDFDYKKTQSVGLNVIGAIANFGIWSETNYNYNEDDEKILDAVLGGDYTFENNLYTVVQYLHREYHDYQIERDDMNYMILYGEMPFKQIHKWDASVIYDFDHDDYLINPEFVYSLSDDLSLNLGTVIMSDLDDASTDSLLKMSKEKTYFELSYSF